MKYVVGIGLLIISIEAICVAVIGQRKCIKHEKVNVTRCSNHALGPADKYCLSVYTTQEFVCMQWE